MGFIQRRLAAMLGNQSNKFDPCLGDPEVREVITRLGQGDWSFVEDAMKRRSDAWLIEDVLGSDSSPIPLSVFESWVGATGSAASLSLLGAAQTRAAWEIRGRTYASEVDASAWAGFHGGLRQADASLLAAVELDPSDAGPWVGLMTTARGLGMGREALRERFDNAHAREPFRPDARAAMLQGLCHKWGGSHDEMFAFARWIHADAEPDSGALGLIHLAHFEYAGAERENGLTPSAHFRTPGVAAEVVAAAEAFLEASPAQAAARHLRPLNMILLSVEPIDHRSAKVTREAVARIAGRPTESPWSMFGDGVATRFRAVSKQRLAAARSF